MKVCEVCGALMATTDTDKRLVMHLEGKLHTGYLQIRKILSELIAKREERRRSGFNSSTIRERKRSRSRENHQRSNRNEKEEEKLENHFYYSSHVHGSGANMPSVKMTKDTRF